MTIREFLKSIEKSLEKIAESSKRIADQEEKKEKIINELYKRHKEED